MKLGENVSKADYNAFGPKQFAEQLQVAINEAQVPGSINPRMRILGTYTQPNRRASGPTPEETKHLQRAAQTLKWSLTLPHSSAAKAHFARATGLAIAAAPSYSRLEATKALNPLRLLMTKAYGSTKVNSGAPSVLDTM